MYKTLLTRDFTLIQINKLQMTLSKILFQERVY